MENQTVVEPFSGVLFRNRKEPTTSASDNRDKFHSLMRMESNHSEGRIAHHVASIANTFSNRNRVVVRVQQEALRGDGDR